MAGRINIDYTPGGPTILAFHRSNAKFRFLQGPVGSAKTTGCVWEIFRRMQMQEKDQTGLRRTKWLVIRSNYRELETTTIPSWLKWFPDPDFGRFKWTPPPTHTIKFGDVRAEVIFLAADDPDGVDKIRGFDVTGAWLNEVNEIPQAILSAVVTRLGRFPDPKNVTWSGIIGDTNPPDPNHWYTKMSQQDLKNWEFFEQPPAVLWDEDSDRWIVNPGREGVMDEDWYMDQIEASTDEWIKVYLCGQTGFVLKGLPVYPEYNDNLHCVEIEANPDYPIVLGADFGLTPAAIIGQEVMGQIRWLDEVVTEDMGAVRFTDHLKQYLNKNYGEYRIAGMWGDPKGEDRSTVDERTVFQVMKAGGLPFIPSPVPKNNFLIRREAVAVPLTKVRDGKPEMIISPKCKITRQGLNGGYVHRKMSVPGEIRHTDLPVKNIYSHCNEAGQYLNVGLGRGQSVIMDIHKRVNQQPMTESAYDIHNH